jgi:MarR family transcriptional regulator, organic hydroperoxide resistance regulator
LPCTTNPAGKDKHSNESTFQAELLSHRKILPFVLPATPIDPANYFVLTNDISVTIILRMSVTAVDVAIVQRCYPQIYLACHTRHKRAASTEHHLSERDSPLLSHLDLKVPISHGELATHLGVRASTLSAAIDRLEKFGYVERLQQARDRRVVMLCLTQKGAAARAATSVLDQDRVAAILSRLTKKNRAAALAGLEILAKASRDFMKASGNKKVRSAGQRITSC